MIRIHQCIKYLIATIITPAKNSVSATMSKTGRQPNAAKSFNCVRMPIAAIAMTSAALEASLANINAGFGIALKLFTATNTANNATNHGSNGGRLMVASCVDARRKIIVNTKITGNNIATRSSFTIVATSPASLLTL